MLTTDFLASAGSPHLTENEALRKLVKVSDPLYTTVAKFSAPVKEEDVLQMVFIKKKNAVKSKKEEVDHTEAKPNVSLFGKVMKRTMVCRLPPFP
uniref:Uncharacterized protein n=1 Tax=Chromera velia CCMP2878 TaxID=1169474 RepID=A0A0G4H8L7_9ALVE|eukprot:Cvel_25208.t1-p1 / transcript=Cvel_25208.t1 / gene=Cvel_25208 / organism=Chromera_velia_CCMP2878 / gene_product=hypothetical protein / transcript_product=hypothetical protein / location=Cvel_scaffold2825:3723-4004(-) / protein_length=94 / sequence_SO=supercontig / SO=protein_coding / is_pseudo=false